MAYGHKVNSNRRLQELLMAKDTQQFVVITNNLSTIDQNQQLLVHIPNLDVHDLIIPGAA